MVLLNLSVKRNYSRNSLFYNTIMFAIIPNKIPSRFKHIFFNFNFLFRGSHRRAKKMYYALLLTRLRTVKIFPTSARVGRFSCSVVDNQWISRKIVRIPQWNYCLLVQWMLLQWDKVEFVRQIMDLVVKKWEIRICKWWRTRCLAFEFWQPSDLPTHPNAPLQPERSVSVRFVVKQQLIGPNKLHVTFVFVWPMRVCAFVYAFILVFLQQSWLRCMRRVRRRRSLNRWLIRYRWTTLGVL